MRRVLGISLVTLLSLGAVFPAWAEGEINVYSGRHYSADSLLYDEFTKQTGIKVNLLEDKEDALIERLKAEGENSPGDVMVTVDAGRLWRADQADLFAPVKSAILEDRIPSHLRHPNGHWFGFSTRARGIVYSASKLDSKSVHNYADLADPKWKGQICIRSGSHIYNLSLLGSMIAHAGAEAAKNWAAGIVANMARPPQGGDTDQIKAVAAGECSLAIVNSYYYLRLLKSDKIEDQALAKAVGMMFPGQETTGTHVNISGAGMLKHAPHPDAARKFLEYLASDAAQRHFANDNNEFPVVSGIENEAEKLLGAFRKDQLPITQLGEYQIEAQKIVDAVGWK